MAVLQTPNHRCALALITHVPGPGIAEAKQPPLTPAEATALKHCFLRDVTAKMARLVDAGRAEGIVIFTPRSAEAFLRGLVPPGFKLFHQRGETPGEVLSNAIEDLFDKGFPSVCLVNSDSPLVPAAVFEVAVNSLAREGDQMVVGALDRGGFYLLGIKAAHRHLLERISSSILNVLEHTSAQAARIGLKVEMLPPSYEVKDAKSFNRLCKDVLGSGGSDRARAAPYTCQYLARLIEAYGAEGLSPDLARQS